MNDLLSKMINYANLEILEFDVTPRDVMEVYNRVVPYSIMSYLKCGKAYVAYNGKKIVTEPGTVVILPSNLKHDHVVIPGERALFLWWHFRFTVADSFDLLKLFDFPAIFALENAEKFEEFFLQYIELQKQPDSIENIIMKKAKSLEVMALLFGSAISQTSYDVNSSIPRVYTKMLMHIVNNSDKLEGLNELARLFNLHPTYISNTFKKYFGITPIHLQHNIQFQKAKDLLRTQNFTITEVADMLGYDNVSSFSRFFTDKAGISPSQFMRDHI